MTDDSHDHHQDDDDTQKKPQLQRIFSEFGDNRVEASLGGPSLEKALRYQNLTCPRNHHKDGVGFSKYKLWKCDDNDFKKYGLGTLLWFQCLRRLAILFFVLFLCSIFPFYLNSVADSSDASYFLLRPSFGSQGDTNVNSNNQTVTVEGIDRKMIGLINMICDATYTLIFLLSIYFMAWLQRRASMQYHSEILTVSRYSVAVANLPQAGFTRAELRAHFYQFGEVVDVNILYSNFKLIQLYCDRGSLRKQLVEAETMRCSPSERHKKIVSIKQKIVEAEHEIGLERLFTGTRPVTAYVVFEKQTDSDHCLRSYVDSWFARLFQPRNLRFLGKRIKVTRAPEPSNILYENLSFSSFNKRLRRMLTFFVTVGLILLTTVLLYVAQYVHDNKIPTLAQCDALPRNFNVDKAYNENTDESRHQVECYCATLDLADLIGNDEYCSEYIKTFALNNSLIAITAISTLVVNAVINYCVEKISAKEKHTNQTSQQRAIVKKLAVGLTLNTGLIIILVNADLSSVFEKVGLTFLVNSRGFQDLTPAWYISVGQSIILTMLIGVIMPALKILLATFVDWCRRSRVDLVERKKNQEELNKVFRGRPFTLHARYASVFVTVYVCFTYSGGMPILLLIASATFTVMYWSDKFAFINIFAIPPRFGEELDSLTTRYLPGACIFHSLMSIGFYSSVCADSFTFVYQEAQSLLDNSGITDAPLDLGKRLQNVNVLPFVVIAGLLVLFFLLRGVISFIACDCCCKQGDKLALVLPRYFGQQIGERPTYYEACAKVRMESYRLSKQSNYRLAYLLTASKKQMPEELSFSDVHPKMAEIKIRKQSKLGPEYSALANASPQIGHQRNISNSMLSHHQDSANPHWAESAVEMSVIKEDERSVGEDHPHITYPHSQLAELPGMIEEDLENEAPPSYEAAVGSPSAQHIVPKSLADHRRVMSAQVPNMIAGSRSPIFSATVPSSRRVIQLQVSSTPNARQAMDRGFHPSTPQSISSDRSAASTSHHRHARTRSLTKTQQIPFRRAQVTPHLSPNGSCVNNNVLASLALDELTSMSVLNLEQLFASYDKDRTGKLSRKQLHVLAGDCVSRVVEAQTELIRLTNPGLNPVQLQRAVNQELRLIFPGRSGDLPTTEEMSKFMARKLIATLDVNNDGEISKNEFTTQWASFASIYFVQRQPGAPAGDLECVIC